MLRRCTRHFELLTLGRWQACWLRKQSTVEQPLDGIYLGETDAARLLPHVGGNLGRQEFGDLRCDEDVFEQITQSADRASSVSCNLMLCIADRLRALQQLVCQGTQPAEQLEGRKV